MTLSKILARRDWFYTLSLLIPFVVYVLLLKILILYARISEFSTFGISTPFRAIYLELSDVFFVLGYALLWIGLFSAARKGLLRWAVVFLFHATTLLVVVVTTCAYQYLKETGTTLDYTVIFLWLPRLDELMPYIIKGVPSSGWMLLIAAMSYVLFGPWLITRLVSGWRDGSERPFSSGRQERASLLSSLLVCCLALAFGSLSTQVGSGWMDDALARLPGGEATWQINKPLLRAPIVNVMVTMAEELHREEATEVASDEALENSSPASLVPTTSSERRNVVIILLESTRAQSVTPYNEDLKTTPFLNELAKNSLLFEKAYVVQPYSSKANVAINCGISPQPILLATGLLPEARPGGIPSRCLPDLLKTEGYSSAYFLASSGYFENFGGLVNNFGYDYFSSPEERGELMDSVPIIEGVPIYEDTSLLNPSEEWLKKQKESGNPFLATYFTMSPHYPYEGCQKNSGSEDFDEDEELNRYLNCLHVQDTFLNDLFDQYKELGLYEDTVFIILGDHGEAFGEHGLKAHHLLPYDEALRIPLIIHDPQQLQKGARVTAPVSQLDILPTVAEMLGYEINGGAYQGRSLLGPLPEDRTLNFSCWGVDTCLASLKGNMKYIYFFDNQPDQLFDLSNDPFEEHDLASDRQNEVEVRRAELLAWRSSIDAMYRGPQRE